jgi:hypothetical protein
VNVLEGVSSHAVGEARLVLQIMDVDSKQPIAPLVAFDDFVVDVFAIRGLGPYENSCDRSIQEAIIDEFMDCDPTFELRRFP